MPEAITRSPIFYEIPKGAIPGRCRGEGCGQLIYWGQTPRGKRIPLTIALEGCVSPSLTEPGFGQAHHIDCPAVEQFRQARKNRR